ncbi:MAG: T9SS type A sorting domain-containing protein [Flavobacteriales bacterium]|nr:T9SS type A sorting domain-containing protein [Flavobacteriales bacterium]
MKKQLLLTVLLFCYGFAFSQCDLTNLATTNTTAISVTLNWQSVNATSYSVKWRISGSTTSWNSNDTNVNQTPSLISVDTLFLDSLSSNTSYDWRVRSFGCSPNNWVDGTSFSTLSACNINSIINTTDASCVNTLDGAADLTVTSGTPPFSFNWSNGATTEDLLTTASGTYIVTITDSTGCILNDTAIIGFIGNNSVAQSVTNFIDTMTPNLPGVVTGYNKWAYDTLFVVNTGCDVNIRPEFIISHQDSAIQQGDFILKWKNPILGNWPTIPYTIDNNGDARGFWGVPTGDSTGTLLGVGTTQQMTIKVKFYNPANYGVYSALWETFEVDNLGNKIQSLSAADSVSINLVDCSIFTIDSTSSTTTTCNGGSDGTATVSSITNGSGSYSYLWNDGQTTATASNLSAGTYSVTVTDNNLGCVDSINVIVTQPNLISALVTGTHISCNGANDGTILGIGTGGSGNYKYTWTPSLPASASHSGLGPNTYTLTLLDMGCGGSSVDSFTVIEPNTLIESATSSDNYSCDSNNCNGNINISLTGGTLPHSFIWANGDSTSSRTNLCGGFYSIIVTDANNCNTFTENITIVDTSTSPNVSIQSQNNTSCDSTLCNGNITITENIGANPYTFLWDNGDTTTAANNLCNGTFSISITDSNACILTNNIIIYDSASTPNIGVIGTNISCFGLIDGTAEAMILSGGGGTTPSYCASTVGTNNYSNIELVRLIGDSDSIVNNTAGSCDTYEDYTSQSTTLTPGNNYSIDINLGSCDPGGFAFTDGAKVFIDWNIDGDFDDTGEEVGLITISQSPSSHSINFTVPVLGFFGNTRMRVVAQYNADATIGSCDIGTWVPTYQTPWYGATEDYTLKIDGAIPASYLWSTGDTTSQINNLSAGTYIITISDTSNCTVTDSISITQPTAILASATTTNVSCNGGNDGITILSITGGTSPYIENWNGIDSSALAAGTYIYTITDSNNCTFTDSVTITEPTAISATAVITNVVCNGDSSGNVFLNISGGTSPYTENWNGINTSSLSAGTYTFIITDTNNCTFIDSITISQPNPITYTITTTDNACNNVCIGSASITASPVYSAVSHTITNLGFTFVPDTIYVTKGDTINFNIGIAHNVAEVSQAVWLSNGTTSNGGFSLPFGGGSFVTDSAKTYYYVCQPHAGLGMKGVIIVNDYYTYSWSNSSTTSTINNLCADTYNFSISNIDNCTVNDSIIITEPNAISVIKTTTNVSCNGASDGTASLTLNGGTGTLTADWGTANPNTLAAGTHYFTITDSNNCTFTDSVIITEPNAISVTDTTTNVLCNGDSTGTATLIIIGGTTPYIESWNNSANPNALPAGIHSFTITDGNSCTLTDSVSISEPAILSTSYNITDVSCFNGSDGAVTLYIAGGTIDYTVSAFGVTLPLFGGLDSVASVTFMPTGVPAGPYPFVVLDANGCSTSDSVIINEPPQLTYSFTKTDVTSCGLADGTINSTINGGTAPFNYAWSNGDTTANVSNLAAGQYIVTITDSNNCSISDTIIITQPSNNLMVTTTTSNFNTYAIACNGDNSGSITPSVSGGTPGYSYLWSDGQTTATAINLTAGTYWLTVTDTNNCAYTVPTTLTEPAVLSQNITTTNVLCNGSNDGTITLSASGGVPNYIINWGGITNPNALSPNTYIISTTDSNNCVVTDTVIISEPNLLSGSIMITSNYNGEDVSCNGGADGSVMASMFGGTPPYNYSWSSGGTAYMEDSLFAGTYSVTITDSNNCSTTIPINITEPNAITSTLTTSNVSCNGVCDGAIIANISGGTTPFTYNWSNNDTSQNIDSLCAGNYNLVLFDANGCMITDSAIISQPNALTITSDSIRDVSYFGTNTGFVYTSVNGGNSLYTYSWIGPNGFTSNNQDLDSVFVGTYILTVTDSLGCTATMQFIVDGPAGFPLAIQSDSLTDVRCNGACDGNIFITAEGGDSIYFYTWTSSNGFSSTQKDISGLCPGIYNLQLSDSSGNIFNTSYQISEPNALSISTSADSALCYNGTGLATVYPIGGTPNYSYLWNSGSTTQSTLLTAGTYSILVTDSNNCTISDSITILQADSMIVSSTDTNSTCFGLNDGSIIINIISGGAAPFNYSNDNGVTFQSANTFFNLAAATYNMIIMDDNGCTSSLQTIITEPTQLTFTITATDATCYGYCDGTAILNISGGTPTFIENWSGLNPLSLCAGLINVSVTDQNGCIATNSVTINEPAPLIVNISQNGDTLDAGTGFVTYQWLDANLNPITGATSQLFRPTSSGEYSVTVTDANGCSATSFSFMFITDGIAELSTVFNVYPNPTKSIVNIDYKGFEIKSLVILDLNGNIVLQNDIKERSGKSIQLSLNHLQKGMYLLQLITNQKIINQSVILQ